MIIVTGTVGFDHILDFNGKFADHILPGKIHKINISFTAQGVKKGFGGTGGNQSYNIALLGEKPILCTTVGFDFKQYKTFLRDSGVNTDYVEEVKKPCAVGFVMTDKDDNQIWAYASGAALDIEKFSLRYFLKKIGKRSLDDLFVMIAPQNEKSMIKWARECQSIGLDYMFDPAFYIPGMGKNELKEALNGAKLVFGNDYEIELISQKLKMKTQKLAKENIWVKTLGPDGSIIYYNSGKEIKIEPAQADKVVDPTGAGDAYRAGFVAGYLRRFPIRVCGRMGSVAASFAIEKYGTMNHQFSIDQFKRRYKENYSEELELIEEKQH